MSIGFRFVFGPPRQDTKLRLAKQSSPQTWAKAAGNAVAGGTAEDAGEGRLALWLFMDWLARRRWPWGGGARPRAEAEAVLSGRSSRTGIPPAQLRARPRPPCGPPASTGSAWAAPGAPRPGSAPSGRRRSALPRPGAAARSCAPRCWRGARGCGKRRRRLRSRHPEGTRSCPSWSPRCGRSARRLSCSAGCSRAPAPTPARRRPRGWRRGGVRRRRSPPRRSWRSGGPCCGRCTASWPRGRNPGAAARPCTAPTPPASASWASWSWGGWARRAAGGARRADQAAGPVRWPGSRVQAARWPRPWLAACAGPRPVPWRAHGDRDHGCGGRLRPSMGAWPLLPWRARGTRPPAGAAPRSRQICGWKGLGWMARWSTWAAGQSHYVLGSGADCDVRLAHGGVAPRHAMLAHHRSGLAYLIDLGSGRGTSLDGEQLRPLAPAQLRRGCQLALGAAPAIVLSGGELASVRDLLAAHAASEDAGSSSEAADSHEERQPGHGPGAAARAGERRASPRTRRNTAQNRSAGSPGAGPPPRKRPAQEAPPAAEADAAAEGPGPREGPPGALCPPLKVRRTSAAGRRVWFHDAVDEIEPDEGIYGR
ncbi:unnamed protein product [Prorocentrum cordatum]|uniref:FHA domain-containing protein n=1 Tax=Prorocentrum cordatum TaxID=2364126 RepID=A0ABN9VMS9_9DINO|nr:unnamed protein product [Polarella glacialis]